MIIPSWCSHAHHLVHGTMSLVFPSGDLLFQEIQLNRVITGEDSPEHMDVRPSFATGFFLCFLLIILPAPSVLAGGAGAGFGDYGDFGVSEGARMGANPHYSGLIAGNISATSSTPRVMTPLPTVTPIKAASQVQVQQNTTKMNATESNQTNTSAVADNFTNSSTSMESKNLTPEPSIGELIRAGDWNAINAYHKKTRASQSDFLDTTRANQSQTDNNSLKTADNDNQNDTALAGDDDSVVTVVYPCS